MNVRSLPNRVMINVSGAVLSPEAAAIIEKSPILRAYREKMVARHAALESASMRPVSKSQTAERLEAIRAEQGDLSRAVLSRVGTVIDWMTTTGTLHTDPAAGRRILALRDALFPSGAVAYRATYGEVGREAVLLQKKLTPAMKKELRALVMPGGHLLAPVESIAKTASKLLDLDSERSRLEAQKSSEIANSSSVVLLNARNRWVRTMKVFRSLVLDDDYLTEEERKQLLARLEQEVSKRSRPVADNDDGDEDDDATNAEEDTDEDTDEENTDEDEGEEDDPEDKSEQGGKRDRRVA